MPQDLAAVAAGHLRRPGLVVVAGPPGAGRSTVLRRLAEATPGAVHTGGGLAMLTAVPALALSRAVRARLPAHDIPLLAEAVRSRVRGGLLILDDLQYADAATLAALPLLAAHCRVAVGLRTPHRLTSDADAALRAAAAAWLTVPPLEPAAAADLARRTATLDPGTLDAVVARAGGNPLAIVALARQAGTGRGAPGADIDQVAYAIAAALADLPRPARTALAALGLLGRPAPAALLGPGAADLLAAGLAADTAAGLQPTSGYVAETAAGLLDGAARTELHRRLAELTAPAEAAQHLAAAGDLPAAHRRALQAADRATGAERAALLLFACDLPGIIVDPRVRLAAADAALAAGRPHAAARVLDTGAPLGVEADVLRAEALLQAGDPAAARRAARPVPDAAAASVVAARDRILLLADLATDPGLATDTADKITARHPHPPPGLAAALAAVRAAHRTPGWEHDLASNAAGGDPLTARWSAWQLVEHLTADARLADAAAVARDAAAACATELAYSWQTRFAAAADFADALAGAAASPAVPGATASAAVPGGTAPPTVPGGTPAPAGLGEEPDPFAFPAGADPGTAEGADPADVIHRRAADLTDRSLPPDARGYATAATALVEADTGLLAAARARLAEHTEHPAAAWVAREAAWLDGQPDRAAQPPAEGRGLLTGLDHITARWAAHDRGAAPPTGIPRGLPGPARRTLTAWATGTGFTAAADTWAGTAVREQVRCLLAAGAHEPDPGRAVAALLAAEQLADTAGLTVLAGRARRGLRRHHVHRDTRGPRSGTQLTGRETDVLRLVAAGEPTRRIAGQLGISAETVDTHIRAAMRKLGARTRTEAAALAFAHPDAQPPREDRR
ncbi:regulatory LuxR family protein [Krasilnikovia cinnamomea]|uniref:Regulatory LuxR family protein n=1 Tax=Krasilnikovia cinnamomea TaxID=349313 RepID=A0A4V2G7X6_9ACTN|nr:LuxR C-terminal-related transcriptional regulator [Krasilnikovia cinnamomea]RZU54266.1 regulatory LuxR family protein [Krasilnikovia cinnamomea]